MLKARDLLNLSDEELKGKLTSLNNELFKLNQQRYSGRVEKPHLFRETKKDIARIEAILNAKTKSNERKKVSKEG